MNFQRAAEWIQRLNAIGRMSNSERLALKAECEQFGDHLPSGEQLMTNPPMDICRVCGTAYHKKASA
jgi:hypothetical protein